MATKLPVRPLRSCRERATSSFGSPIAHDGKVYFVNRQGVVFCLDQESGEEIYARRSPGGSVWATPLVLADKIYLFGKDGVTTVLANADEMTEIATNDLWTSEAAPQQAPPAEGGQGNFGGPVLYAATPHSSGLLMRRGDIFDSTLSTSLYSVDMANPPCGYMQFSTWLHGGRNRDSPLD